MHSPLGVFRALLALLVLCSHLGTLVAVGSQPASGVAYGSIAVFVFFVVSGYVITNASLRHYADRPIEFLANRVLRLYPPYLMALGLMVLVLNLPIGDSPLAGEWGAPRNLLANLFSIFPFVPITDRALGVTGRVDLLGIIWSLRVEFAFYCAVCCALWMRRHGKVVTGRLLLPVCVAVLLLHVVTGYVFEGEGRSAFYLGFSPHFVLGVMVAVGHRATAGAFPWVIAVAAVSLVLGTAGAAAYPDAAGFRHVFHPDRRMVLAALLYAVLAVAFVGLTFCHVKSPRWVFLDNVAGDLSYPLYLVHLPLVVLLRKCGMTLTPVVILAFASVVLATSYLVLRVSGHLMDPLRDRLRRHVLAS